MSTPALVHYRVTHDTHYEYALPVSLSQQLLHLAPRPQPLQQCLDCVLRRAPTLVVIAHP